MDYQKIEEKTIELAELILSKEDLFISRVEYGQELGEELENYEEVIKDVICSNEKFDSKQGRTGGIRFIPKKHRQVKLSDKDKKQIKDSLKQFYQEFLEQLTKEKKANPEKEVQDAFQKWIKREIEKETNKGEKKLFGPKAIVNFRSNARKASKWKNVDGYIVDPKELKYHLQVKPILISFEVKADLPGIDGLFQAKNYLDFSHHSYLVFKYDGDEKEIKKLIDEKDGLGGVGVFYTKDGVDFTMYKKSIPEKFPSEIDVDEALDILLSETDKEKLLKIKYEHLVSELIVPAIQV